MVETGGGRGGDIEGGRRGLSCGCTCRRSVSGGTCSGCLVF